MKEIPKTFTEELFHHYKQPLSHLSAIFLKLSILSMVEDKVSSKTITPLVEEGENLVHQMGMVLQEGELLKYTPYMSAPIDWTGLFVEVSHTATIIYDPTLLDVVCSSHPLLFPHVFKALLHHHATALTTQGKIAITHHIENSFLTLTILRDQNLWDERSAKKVFFPFFDLSIPAPHWDLSIISNLVSAQLNGELTAVLKPSHCGFHLTIPLNF